MTNIRMEDFGHIFCIGCMPPLSFSPMEVADLNLVVKLKLMGSVDWHSGKEKFLENHNGKYLTMNPSKLLALCN